MQIAIENDERAFISQVTNRSATSTAGALLLVTYPCECRFRR